MSGGGAFLASIANVPRGRSEEVFAAGRVVSLDTNEFDELNECTTGWSVEHHPLGADACRSTTYSAAMRSLQLAVVQHSKGYSSQGANPAGAVSIVVPFDEARPMVHRGHAIRTMQLGVIHSGEGYECVCRLGSRFVMASVPQERMEGYARDLWHAPDVRRGSMDRLRFVDSTHRARYLDACGRLLSTIRAQPGVLGDPRAASVLEEMFLESLFANAGVVPPRPKGHARYDLARRAYAYLRDNVDAVPSIRQLCAAMGSSYSTLERGFSETYGMSPKRLMTAMRLSRARRTLLQPAPTDTVTAVALRWGFVELGRFSGLYHHRYGEVPSQTLRRVRGSPLLKSA